MHGIHGKKSAMYSGAMAGDAADVGEELQPHGGDRDPVPEEDSVRDVLVHQDVLASIMAQLGLRGGLRAAAVCTAWRLAALAAQEEQRVLRPSHSLGWGNEALGQFRSPSGILMLPSGELCVADTNNHRLQILSRSGEVSSVVGHGPGSGAGDFQQPTGLACDGKFLYVADSGNCRLHKLALPDMKPVATIGSFGEGAGQLHAPVGLALHSSAHGAFLFCADSRNHRIAVFLTTPELRFVRTFGSHGTGAGELGPTSSGIYLACSEGELFVADRANHRLQVFSTEGSLLRTIGQRGTAPGCFRRIRGVAVHRRKIFTGECERVQVLSLLGEPLQVLPMPGSSALVGVCADDAHVCVVDQTHQKVRVLSFLHSENRPTFGTPRAGEPHLAPFLLPTAVCDSGHPSIVALSRRLVPTGCTPARAASAVRAWVRSNIAYALRDKSETASETLARREGMCTNKANLQVALLRAAGIPAGYVLAHITKEAFICRAMLNEVYKLISPITLHIFCSVYIPYPLCPPSLGNAGRGGEQISGLCADLSGMGIRGSSELGSFRFYDATERTGSTHLLEHVPYTDETRFRAKWLRGPFSPVQSNLDHLLTPGSKVPPELLERQNASYRAHPI